MSSINDINGKGSLTNYLSFEDPLTHAPRIGHYDEPNDSIQPLAFSSGTPLTDLYQVIQVGEAGIKASGEAIPASSAKILPPITGRDILCVGKNYAEHAKEFNSSGYDSSDKVDQPTHPVIFTKRFTSIIADGEEIYPHPEFTETADYEGELGVIVGKPGFRISEADAMDHVWGYTIINDMTARERQRDHKQFYIGKSPDTFCPMGPIAVPAKKLDKTLQVQTHVNGELRQNATTEDLIFSIPYLIMTLSEGQTLMPGDVLATGTPAGVGLGRKPPVYLKPGDEVTVSITGLGKLTNRIGSPDSKNPTLARVLHNATMKSTVVIKSADPSALTTINGKQIHYRKAGSGSESPIVFIHGLGGSSEYWTPLISAAGLDQSHPLHLFDFEGHGLSPTSPLSTLSISSLAADVKGIFSHAGISFRATLIAHSMGCLVAVKFCLENPDLVSKLILLGPPPSPLPEAGSKDSHARADQVRVKGMVSIVDALVLASTSERTKKENPLAIAAIRLSLLGQDPEGYAKACTALAGSVSDKLDFNSLEPETLITTGDEDKVSPPQLADGYSSSIPNLRGVRVLSGVGHWHVFEDVNGVASAVKGFL
ncbi:hypothetical protein BDV97DRAFT_393846 [Delphinella strobiligena]|nr:hypothetical protein BDV97DRAFT_393846 [Delphinella strobiligena]